MGTPDMKELMRQNEELKARLALANKPKAITLKVSEKSKALSVYGLGRFPVTLYKTQWQRLIAETKRIHDFIVENDALLADKTQV